MNVLARLKDLFPDLDISEDFRRRALVPSLVSCGFSVLWCFLRPLLTGNLEPSQRAIARLSQTMVEMTEYALPIVLFLGIALGVIVARSGWLRVAIMSMSCVPWLTAMLFGEKRESALFAWCLAIPPLVLLMLALLRLWEQRAVHQRGPGQARE